MKLTLSARQPFVFHSVIRSHGWCQLASLHWEEATGALHLPLHLASNRVAPLTVQTHAEGVMVHTPGRLTNTEKNELAERVAWMFNLDADFDEFYALVDQEPGLAHCRPHGHGRMLRSPTLFEDVVKVMATTNIQWGGAKRHDYIGVDTEAVSLVSKNFYGGAPVGEKEIEAIFGRWGKFKSLVYWFWDWNGTQPAPMAAWEAQKVHAEA